MSPYSSCFQKSYNLAQLWSPNLELLVATCIHYVYCEPNQAVNTNPKDFLDRGSGERGWGLKDA